MKDAKPERIYLTSEVAATTGYSIKTLYMLEKRGIVRPLIASTGLKVWRDGDIAIIKAHKEKMRPKRMAAMGVYSSDR